MIIDDWFFKKMETVYKMLPYEFYRKTPPVRMKIYRDGIFHVFRFSNGWIHFNLDTDKNKVKLDIRHYCWPQEEDSDIEVGLMKNVVITDRRIYSECVKVGGHFGNLSVIVPVAMDSYEKDIIDKYSLLSPNNDIDADEFFNKVDLMLVMIL